MKYLELKQDLSKVNEDLDKCSFDIREHKKSKLDIEGHLSKLESNLDQEIEKAKSNKLLDFENEITDPFRVEIKKLENQKLAVNEKHKQLISNIDENLYRERFLSKNNIEKNEELIKNIDEVTSSFYGKELYSDIKSVVDDSIDLDSSVDSIASLTPRLSIIKKFSNPNASVVDRLLDLVSDIEVSKEHPEKFILVVVACLVALIGYYKLFPVVILGLLVACIYNLYKSYVCLRCVSFSKSFSSNKEELEENTARYVKKCVEKEKDKIDSDYDKAMSQLNSMIAKIEQDCELEWLRQKELFVFNSDEVQSKYNINRHSRECDLERVDSELKKLETKYNSLKSQALDLQKSIKEELCNLESSFLPNEIQLNENLPNQLLFGFREDEPQFFDLPKCSTIFFYDSLDTVNDFINLLYYQINFRVRPDIVKTYYSDPVYMCEALIGIKDVDNFFPSIDKESWKESLESLTSTLVQRMPLMSQYGGIDEYNEFMLSQDCGQEPYLFLYSLVDKISFGQNQDELKLLLNGPKYGIYPYLFMDYKALEKNPDEHVIKLLESVSKVMYVKDSNLVRKSREFYIKEFTKLLS